jgi:ABC-2 type transport system permease protein
MSKSRILAVYRKELREYRHNPMIVVTMALLPMIFTIQPTLIVFLAPPQVAPFLAHGHLLVWLLAIPATVPATLAAFAVAGERDQGTLEPVLTTPIRRDEFLLAKAAAAFVPSAVIAYALFAAFLASVELFAHPGVAAAVLRGPDVLTQLIFTPLLAAWSIWVGMAFSVRFTDLRAAQQLAVVANLPVVAVAGLIAFGVIHPSLGLTAGIGAALLLLDVLGWRVISTTFSRERLVTGR